MKRARKIERTGLPLEAAACATSGDGSNFIKISHSSPGDFRIGLRVGRSKQSEKQNQKGDTGADGVFPPGNAGVWHSSDSRG